MPRILTLTEDHRMIAALLEAQLGEVIACIEAQLASDLPPVNQLCRHVERYRGKMLRPTLLLACGLATARQPNEPDCLTGAHRTVASVCEMIHMATLVHDDVLDEAAVRRQGDTVNMLHGNETAVMLGDYLISNSFHLCSKAGDPSINLALGAVTNTLCEGELLQLNHRGNHSIDERTYFEIVQRKTASLIGEACRLGAALSRAPVDVQSSLREYGRQLGVAFQIQDDLLDVLGTQRTVGKTLGRDLEKGKLTLPVIRFLRDADPLDRADMLQAIEQADAPQVRARLMESHAVDRCRETAAELVSEARLRLRVLPDSRARALLDALASAVVERKF